MKIKRFGTFPSGQSSVAFAVASAVSLTATTAPALELALDEAPEVVAGDAEVTVSVDVTNDGGLTAFAPRLVLTLPSGWSFATGSSAIIDVADAEPAAGGGAVRTATWEVVTGDTTGSDTLRVAVSSDSYGETFDAADLELDVDVDATDPLANAGPDVAVPADSAAGATVSLDGTASSDDSGQPIALFEWDTDADGDFADAGGSATGSAPDVDFAIGSHAVTLRVTDHVGNTGLDFVDVLVVDAPPVADAGDDVTIDEGAYAEFDGTGSEDVEGDVTYEWLIGGGRILTGPVASVAVHRRRGVPRDAARERTTAGQTDEDTLIGYRPERRSHGRGRTGHDDPGDRGRVTVPALAGSATDPGDGRPARGVVDVRRRRQRRRDSRGRTVTCRTACTRRRLTVTDGDGGSHIPTRCTVTVTNVPPQLLDPGCARRGRRRRAVA